MNGVGMTRPGLSSSGVLKSCYHSSFGLNAPEGVVRMQGGRPQLHLRKLNQFAAIQIKVIRCGSPLETPRGLLPTRIPGN